MAHRAKGNGSHGIADRPPTPPPAPDNRSPTAPPTVETTGSSACEGLDREGWRESQDCVSALCVRGWMCQTPTYIVCVRRVWHSVDTGWGLF